MAETKQNEPSMEEILASIRRIIAEDGEAPKPEGAAAADEVLELTEVVEEEPPPPEPEIELAPEPEPPALDEPPPPPPPPAPPRQPTRADDDRLISTAAAAASVSALAQLTALRKERRGEPGLAFDSGVTIEEMVREMLRPMLRDWLDTNLPSMVERIVRDEVARIVREAQ